MTVKGVKLKSESFFPTSHGVLELRQKNLRGADSPPPPPNLDRVKIPLVLLAFVITLKGFNTLNG